MLSKDALTLVLTAASYGSNTTMLVFARSGKNQPWLQQASLQSGAYYVGGAVLSADGVDRPAMGRVGSGRSRIVGLRSWGQVPFRRFAFCGAVSAGLVTPP